MGRPKKNPEELKHIMTISLTQKEIRELDANIELIRQNLVNSYDLPEDQISSFNAGFNRSAMIREFIGLMSSKAGYMLLFGSMISALDSLGFKHKEDNETRSLF